MNRTVATSVFFLLLGFAAHAQEPAAGKQPLAFRTLGLGYAGEDLFYSNGNKDVPLPVTEDSRSPFLPRPAGASLAFYRMEKLPDGTAKRIPAGTAEISSGGRLPLLIFSPGGKVEVLDDSLEVFPGGSYRVLNRLNEDLGALLGTSPTKVPANSDKVIDATQQKKGTTLFVQLYLLARSPQTLVFSNNWAFSPILRTMVIVVPPVPPSELPTVRRIVESIELPNLSASSNPKTP